MNAPLTPTTQPSQDPPTLSEYAAAIDASYKLTTPQGDYDKDFKPPEGFTLLARSKESKIKDGFSAVALRSPGGNVIVAFEGTALNSIPHNDGPATRPSADAAEKKPATGRPSEDNSYGARSFAADMEIHNGKSPKALKDAVNFVKKVEREFGGPVYVTGHSLGGIEAQAAVKALGPKVAGGMTLGATGLPANDEKGPQGLVNYVDHGDPIGNYATGKQDAPGHMSHFGAVVMTGDADNAAALEGTFSKLTTGMGYHRLAHYKQDLALEFPAAVMTPTAENGSVLKGAGAAMQLEAANHTDGQLVSPTTLPATMPSMGGPVKSRS